MRKFLRAFGDPSETCLRLFARVNAYTELRRLIELAPRDAAELIGVLPDLIDRGLIELLSLPDSGKLGSLARDVGAVRAARSPWRPC